MKFAAPRSVVSKRVADVLVVRSRCGLGISAGSSGISPSTVHPSVATWASSSRELCASFEVLRLPACPHSRNCESASLGVSSLIATSIPASTTPRSPTRGQVPPSAFRTPSTVCSANTFAGLFHPAATSRVRPSGICSSPRSRTGFRRPLPSCRLNETRLRFNPRQHIPPPASGPCSPQ